MWNQSGLMRVGNEVSRGKERWAFIVLGELVNNSCKSYDNHDSSLKERNQVF
jgi:hypothetical protein